MAEPHEKNRPSLSRGLGTGRAADLAETETQLRDRGADGFDLGVLLEDFVAHFAAPAGLFVSAEGQSGVEHVVAIDPNGSGAEQATRCGALS